ncbi:MAG TPA: PKD domain-containing protein [Candidatus Thermoplasmatota archaeon]|nr:PKD domain-containing protein [Candidatus Thermoplasmatota archaeon]
MDSRALTFATILLLAVVPAASIGPASAGSGTPTFAIYAAPSSLASANGAGEPSIGVNWNTGAVHYQSFASTYKVVFNDATVPATATWSDVTPPTSVTNIDPILFTDSSYTTPRVYAGGLAGACSNLAYSDNDGASWTQMGNACAGTVDHETIGAGPWKGAAPLLASYGRAVYYCAQNGVDACSVSKDGGLTFGAPVTVGGACGGLHGHVKVSKDGYAYLPNQNCGGKAGGGITSNNGGAWNSYTIAASSTRGRGFDPSVATTPDNTVYEAWAQGTSDLPYVARSINHGTTWDRVTNLATTVSPPIVASTFQSMVAGDNGRAAVAFLGTTVGGGAATPFDNGYHGVWDLYVSFTYDAGLTWSTQKVTSDPVQRGCIWDGGGTNACRNLLDFMDATVTKDGRVLVGFADGCLACTTEAQSTDSWATIARQSTGKGLFAAYDGQGAAAPNAPTLSATPGNAQVALSWTTPANNGASITAYKLYRNSALYQTLGVVNGYTDTAVTNGQTYTYKVSAVNSVGEGAQSNQVSATPSAGNLAPTACFTHSETGLSTSTSGSCSSDTDGTISSYAWSWGDSTSGSGASASHAYASAGTYTVTLTVTDNGGATGSTSQSVTVTNPGDPDPGATTLSNGVARSATNGATGTWQYYKISVPAGKSQLQVVLDGQACGVVSCNPDLDLFTKRGARPTTSSFDCSPAEGDSDETCTHANPAADWWYIGVYVFGGGSAKTYTIRATYS